LSAFLPGACCSAEMACADLVWEQRTVAIMALLRNTNMRSASSALLASARVGYVCGGGRYMRIMHGIEACEAPQGHVTPWLLLTLKSPGGQCCQYHYMHAIEQEDLRCNLVRIPDTGQVKVSSKVTASWSEGRQRARSSLSSCYTRMMMAQRRIRSRTSTIRLHIKLSHACTV
jgi:hypothetical protein